MPWRTMDVHEQRVEFVMAAARKAKPFRSLRHEFGISRPTGYLWLRRYHNSLFIRYKCSYVVDFTRDDPVPRR
jgi:hypothetical protein